MGWLLHVSRLWGSVVPMGQHGQQEELPLPFQTLIAVSPHGLHTLVPLVGG